MSFGGFGVSAGDLIAVGTFAWNVYKACKGASAEFEEIAHEVVTLHTALKELEDEAENVDSILNRAGSGKKKELDEIIRNCRTVLTQLEKLLTKYKSLGTKSKRTWDRIRFGAEGLQTIREKLTFHTSGINLFLTTLGSGSLGRIEKKLDEIVQEIRAGKREPTVLTTVDDDSEEAEIHWNALKSELLDDGFTRHDVEAHKRAIKGYIQELVDRGGLQESRRVSEPLEHSPPDINEGQSASRECNRDWRPPQDLSLQGGIPTVLLAQSSITTPYQEQPSNVVPVRQREEAVNEPQQLSSMSETGSNFRFNQQHPSSLALTPEFNYGLGRSGADEDHTNDFPMLDLLSEDQEVTNTTSLFPNTDSSTYIETRPSVSKPLSAIIAPMPPAPDQSIGFNPLASPVSGQSPPLKRRASGPVEDYHEDVSEYDEYGRLRKRTIVRRRSNPLMNAMPSHHSSPIPSPSSWGHASPTSGHNSAFLPPTDSCQLEINGWPGRDSPYVPSVPSQSLSYDFPKTLEDTQAARKRRDEMRVRNREAIARFRERRRERSRAAVAQVKQLEEKNLSLTTEIQDLTRKLAIWQMGEENGYAPLKRHVADLTSYVEDVQMREQFYRDERNYFRAIVNQMPDKVDLVRQRPASPVAITRWPTLDSPKPESPLNKVQHMLWETETKESGGLMDAG